MKKIIKISLASLFLWQHCSPFKCCILPALAFDLQDVFRICVLSEIFLWGDVFSVVYVGCWALNRFGSRGCKILMVVQSRSRTVAGGILVFKKCIIPETLQAVLHLKTRFYGCWIRCAMWYLKINQPKKKTHLFPWQHPRKQRCFPYHNIVRSFWLPFWD